MTDERFLNRELSWLAFNERVLELASEPGIPVLERVKFCAIASTNLDEFFQVRVAGLQSEQLFYGALAEPVVVALNVNLGGLEELLRCLATIARLLTELT